MSDSKCYRCGRLLDAPQLYRLCEAESEPTPSASDILVEIGRITDDYFKTLDKVVEKGND